jgi:formylglycine-generating enzyme required for sulfatase activity
VTSRYFGETEELLAEYAWYSGNSENTKWPVGSKKLNDWGFFDVHGNAWTWCQESFKVDLRSHRLAVRIPPGVMTYGDAKLNRFGWLLLLEKR